MKRKKRSGRRWWSIAIILVGFLICSYPIVSGLYQRSVQSDSLKTYSKALRRNEDQVEGLLKAADTYNDMLFQTQGNYIQGISDKYLTEKAYEKQLRLKDSDVMARIEIPKISVDLPIYHGVSESVLSKGVGHLRSSSLPVGGESTHAALSGHRGLPSSKLFTRLDELEKGDLFSGENPYANLEEENDESHGRVLDLVLPILVLIVCCIIGMIYSGRFFDGVDFITAFSNSDASVGLLFGSAFALVFTLVYYAIRRSMTFGTMMSCIPEGFKAMVPAILILTFAWSLKAMTDSLGVTSFVRDFVYSNASQVQMFLPAIVFLIGCFLAFATGTSWGTFGMLIPIVQSVFPMDNPLSVVCISACMAGAVCGDHCSPISDTTIMASAGAQCDHVQHVSTQLPYAITVAAVSFVSYLIAGFIPNAFIALPIAFVLMFLTLLAIRMKQIRRTVTG